MISPPAAMMPVTNFFYILAYQLLIHYRCTIIQSYVIKTLTSWISQNLFANGDDKEHKCPNAHLWPTEVNSEDKNALRKFLSSSDSR